MASVKGKLFEFFVYRLLRSCGFQPVIPDNLLLYKGTPGLMVQGLGQPHNADVLLSPPIQTPFYYPTRLLVECKCYNQPIGLPQIRNALGLREDINNFEIVTEDILRERRNNWSRGQKYYPMKRYVYQVAVASIDGFRSTAISFAQAHRIPLISFSYSSLFDEIRYWINSVESIVNDDKSGGLADKVCTYVNDRINKTDYQRLSIKELYCYFRGNNYEEEAFFKLLSSFENYLCEVDRLEHQITIGLLDDGTFLFMLRLQNGQGELNEYKIYDDGFSVYWYEHDDCRWVLSYRDEIYHFELPDELYSDWKKNLSTEEQKKAFKQGHFSYITLFDRRNEETDNAVPPVRYVRLSKQFINENFFE